MERGSSAFLSLCGDEERARTGIEVDGENEDDEDGMQDDGVEVVGEEGRCEAVREGVCRLLIGVCERPVGLTHRIARPRVRGAAPPSSLTGDDAERDEEGGDVDAHAGHGRDGGGPAQEQHGGDQHVGQEAEAQEDLVGGGAPPVVGDARVGSKGDEFQGLFGFMLMCLSLYGPRPDDLADGVGPWRLALDLDGEDPEEQDLDAGAFEKKRM